MDPIYRIFFLSQNGRYHYGYEFDDLNEAMQTAFRYRGEVPEIRITDELDRLAGHIERGVITEPLYLNDELYAESEPASLPPQGEEGLNDVLNRYDEALAVKNQGWGDADMQHLDRVAMDNAIKQAELDVLAVAARDDLNLYEHDFQPSGLADQVSRELEQEHSYEHGLEL